MPKPIQHILVIRLSAMGDVAMSVPVILAFVDAYPKVKITILTRDFFIPFFEGIPNVTVFCPDLKGRHKGFLGIRRLAKELAKLQLDAVADLHDVLRSNILIQLLRLKGIPFKQIDKGRAEKIALVSAKEKTLKPLKPTHERYVEVFEALGFTINLSKATILSKVLLTEKIIKYINTSERKLIGIAPFAAHKGKMLPLEKMVGVIEQLSTAHQVLLFGGGRIEKEQLDVIAQKYPNVINITGQFSFKEELAIISNLDVMLSMDSGNGHLAAMFGVEVFTIWGVTHPYAGFTPYNQSEKNQIIPDLTEFPLIPTSIYGNKYPEGYLKCFETISVKEIISKIENHLKAN